jgi:hypothetical protein
MPEISRSVAQKGRRDDQWPSARTLRFVGPCGEGGNEFKRSSTACSFAFNSSTSAHLLAPCSNP